MKMTSEEFEAWMVRLDEDPTVDAKERKLILQKMGECETRAEFDKFIASIAIPPEEEKKKELTNAV